MDILYGDTTFLNQYLLQALKTGDLYTAQSIMNQRYDKQKTVPLEEQKCGSFMLLSVLSHELLKQGITTQAFHPIYNRCYQAIDKTRSIIDLKKSDEHMLQSFLKMYDKNWVKTNHNIVNDVLAYIHMHLEHKLNASIIAEALHYSPSYIQRIFKKTMNMSLMAYIKQAKINHGITLLDMSLNISEVAHILHFYDSPHFIRTFKQITGQTPLQYRKTKHNKNDL